MILNGFRGGYGAHHVDKIVGTHGNINNIIWFDDNIFSCISFKVQFAKIFPQFLLPSHQIRTLQVRLTYIINLTKELQEGRPLTKREYPGLYTTAEYVHLVIGYFSNCYSNYRFSYDTF